MTNTPCPLFVGRRQRPVAAADAPDENRLRRSQALQQPLAPSAVGFQKLPLFGDDGIGDDDTAGPHGGVEAAGDAEAHERVASQVEQIPRRRGRGSGAGPPTANHGPNGGRKDAQAPGFIRQPGDDAEAHAQMPKAVVLRLLRTRLR